MSGFKARAFMLRVISVSIICMGFAQVAPAGMIGTAHLVDNEARAATLSRMEVLLARADVAQQLESHGVEKEQVVERLNGLTTAELLELEGQIDEQIAAGADVLAVIGIVFVVLLILDLTGVTDVFKSI
jgi:hypothetical protein